jgi:DNA polymerase-3 subunit gamma/tau
MPLQIDYRPDCFDEFVGSEEIIQALQNRFRKNEIPHSYLITGASGCGKTTLGRIIATELGAFDPEKSLALNINYKELDSADFRGIDTIREIRKNMGLTGIGGGNRVWLLDECHQLTKDAQEALLKALEDSPAHSFFILCTTDPEKLKITLKRRCLALELEPLSIKEMIDHLSEICEAEEIEVPKKILKKIALDSMGSAGVAMGILDRIIHLQPSQMEKAAEKVAARESQVIDLCRALFQRKKWPEISKILQGLEKEDPEKTRRAVMQYCGNTLLGEKDHPQAALVMDCFREPFYNNGRNDLILSCYEIIQG